MTFRANWSYVVAQSLKMIDTATGRRRVPMLDPRFWTYDSLHAHPEAPKLCRPHQQCDAPQSGVPRTENQIDFFVKSELKLHILHAFGILQWHL